MTSTTADPTPANNTSTASTTVTASADLAITKTGPATVVAGGAVSYSLVVVNNGPSDAAAVSVTDTLPAGVTFVSASGTGWTCTNTGNTSVTCTLPTLAAAATAPTITVTTTAPAQAASLTNTASVASTTADPTPGNNTSTAITTVTASADLAILKTGPATATAGSNIDYTLTVTNNGPSDAAAVSMTDTLPAGVTFVSATGTGWTCTNTGNISVTCTLPTLAGGTAAPDITVTITAPAQAATLTNTASVSSTTSDSDPANNTSTSTTAVTAAADLAIVKTGPATVTAGASVTYSLTVTNNGPSDAAAVSVTDTLPAGVTFVSATGTGWVCGNAGNVSVTCTLPALATATTAPAITVVVTAPDQGGTLSNAASVSATTADPDPGNNTATANTTVTALADLSLIKTGPATIAAGGSISYTLAVTDNGPSDVAVVTVTDTLPAGVTYVSATGTGWTCTNAGNISVTCTRPTLATGTTAPGITVVVTAPAQATALSNTATVSSTTTDPTPGNNTSTVATTVTASADLSIVKTGPVNVLVGADATYVLTVTNNGPSDAAAVSVTDTLPAGVTFVSAGGTGWTCTNTGNVSVTCTVPSLSTGVTAPAITIVVTAPGVISTLSNTASVTSTTSDPDPTNNTSTISTSVGPAADLAITKSGPASVVAGGAITYTLSVSNSGPSDAVGVSVVDTLPAGVTFVSAAGTGWTCTHVGNVSVTCTLGTLATGTTASGITVVVTAPGHSALLSNGATVSSTTLDINPANNSSTANTAVGALADLSLVKTGPATVHAGSNFSYHLVVKNAGPDAAALVTVTDTLPPGVTFVSARGSGWTCTHVGNVTVTCTRPSLASGTTAPTITVVVKAPAAVTNIANAANVSSSTLDPVPNNNSSSVPTQVLAALKGGGKLPHTGADGLGFLPLGVLLLALGATLVAVVRRRTR